MFLDGVITMDGLALDAKIRAGLATAVFTAIKFGDGLYNGTEDLSQCGGMKSVRQSFGISSICVIDKKQVRLRTVTDNAGIEDGYYISELGVYAEDPDKGEILYSLSLGVPQKMDYQPSETELAGATGTFDVYTDVSNVEEATVAVGTGAAASAEDLAETNAKVEGLLNTEFDDSGTVEEVKSFPDFLRTMVSGMGFFKFMRNAKAGFQFVLHAGQIVNNCVTDRADLPGSAAQLKVLMDLITKLNSDFNSHSRNVNDRLIRGNGYTALSVNGKEEGISHRLQINDSGIAAVYHSDSSGGNWSPDPIALKSDLQTIFPSKSYDTSIGTFVNFDDITQSQIASVFIGNDGSNKTPTGRDGILLVFNSQWTVQLFFDYAMEMLWRIKWGNWKQWERISSLPS